MTAQQINHVANLAIIRAAGSADSSEQWEAVIALKRLAWSAAAREIAADGYSMICAPLP